MNDIYFIRLSIYLCVNMNQKQLENNNINDFKNSENKDNNDKSDIHLTIVIIIIIIIIIMSSRKALVSLRHDTSCASVVSNRS